MFPGIEIGGEVGAFKHGNLLVKNVFIYFLFLSKPVTA